MDKNHIIKIAYWISGLYLIASSIFMFLNSFFLMNGLKRVNEKYGGSGGAEAGNNLYITISPYIPYMILFSVGLIICILALTQRSKSNTKDLHEHKTLISKVIGFLLFANALTTFSQLVISNYRYVLPMIFDVFSDAEFRNMLSEQLVIDLPRFITLVLEITLGIVLLLFKFKSKKSLEGTVNLL